MQSCQNFIYKVNYEQRLEQIYQLPMGLEKKKTENRKAG